jgi:hypothetical protein
LVQAICQLQLYFGYFEMDTFSGVLILSTRAVNDNVSAKTGGHVGTNNLSSRALRNTAFEVTDRSIVDDFKIGAIFVELEGMRSAIAVIPASCGFCATSIPYCLCDEFKWTLLSNPVGHTRVIDEAMKLQLYGGCAA